jgi:hypothetical protein
MSRFILSHPLVVFVFSTILLWIAAQVGNFLREHARPLTDDERGDFDVVLTAALTLLGLIIGFSFSMAISRYDQRKNYEEAEANAIGTEYLRVDFLPLNDAARARDLLKKYLALRIQYYEARNRYDLEPINRNTIQIQNDLWSTVRVPAAAAPSPLMALAALGMNDVLNSQGYTQAAYWNRIPPAAWLLMFLIAIACNILIGYSAHHKRLAVFLILPLTVAISFFLIADIDSPRGGIILVRPQNLLSLQQSLQ